MLDFQFDVVFAHKTCIPNSHRFFFTSMDGRSISRKHIYSSRDHRPEKKAFDAWGNRL